MITKILSTSKELEKKSRIIIKDTTNCLKFDDLLKEHEVVEIAVDTWARLETTKDDGTVYTQIVIIDKNGNKYATGSNAFESAFTNIADEMGDEEFVISVFGKDSKNYKGKKYITCSLIG